MSPVLYERDARIGRITLNRPEVMNAIDDRMPQALADAVCQANADERVHVIVLSGAGDAFCAGYDLTYYAQTTEGPGRDVTQPMPWDPVRDFAWMKRNTDLFMEIFRSGAFQKPLRFAQIWLHTHPMLGSYPDMR